MNCNQKDKKPELRERKIDKINDVNFTSTYTQLDEAQGKGTSNIHDLIQNQEQQ